MERFTAGGQGPTSGCSAVEEEEEEGRTLGPSMWVFVVDETGSG